jgi:hypothetical protein
MSLLRTAPRKISASNPWSVHRSFSSARPLLANRNPKILLQDKDTGYGFIRHNPRTDKPRTKGVTEIRGPYYSVMGKRYLQDVLETMGYHVDGLKFAGGSFSLFPEDKLRELLELAHEYGVYVSTVRQLVSSLSCRFGS